MSLVNTLVSQRKLKPRLGPPDVYPQDPNQKEDELSAVHVKQGFSTTYANLLNNDEYGSSLSKAVNLNPAKIWNNFKDILAKKEDNNTFQEVKDKNKRQPINVRDDFWLVTANKKFLVDKYIKDLAGTKPLSLLAKRVPIFNRRDDILRVLCEFDVPVNRGVWLIKMTAAYAAAMQEANKSKKKVAMDPSAEWTSSLIKFILEQREQLQQILANPGGSLSMGLATFSAPDAELKPENCLPLKLLLYTKDLCWYMHQQGLLDRQEFLQAILEMVEKCKNPEDPLFRLLMPTLLRYCNEFSQSELLARKMAYQCTKKITQLILETDGYAAALAAPSTSSTTITESNSAGSSRVTTPTKPPTMPGSNQPMPPVLAGLMELQNDSYHRLTILTLSALLQTIVLECPAALVWNYFGENKTPSSLLGSPLDHLPNIAPSSLPMPPRADNAQIRARLRVAESFIRDRSAAAETNWSNISNNSDNTTTTTRHNSSVVAKILSVLEELDRFLFDKNDPNSNCLDALATRIWGPLNAPGQGLTTEDEAVVTTLCEWAVTGNRSGEHRAFVAAKLLDQRQSDIFSPDGDDEEGKEEDFYGTGGGHTGTPVFQDLLFKFLDTDAPCFTTPNPEPWRQQEMANLILLFHELMAHDVFSHDAYMCFLISRGDLNNPIERGNTASLSAKDEEGGGGNDAANTSDDRINDDIGAIVKQISETNKLDEFNGSGEPPPGTSTGGGGGDSPSNAITTSSLHTELWKYNRHWQYTYHFPIPFPQDDSAAHDINQRHVLLYGSGRGRDESSRHCRKLTKELLKLFSKRFAIDVNEGGKVKKHHRNEFLFGEVVARFQELSYFEQHLVTATCGQAVIEMVQAFHSAASPHLPVIEHVSFLCDLAGQAFNIQALLDWCLQLLKELPSVESQLIDRGSVLTRSYTTGLALYIVGVLRRYHTVLILTESDVKAAWDALVRIAYRHSNVPPHESPRHESSGGGGSSSTRRPPPNLDCNSAEWCIMAYLYDLATACPALLKSSDKYSLLKRLFYQTLDRATSVYPISEQFREMIAPYIQQPKKKVDPLIVRYLHEKPEHQYTLVVSVISAILLGQLDNDRLNDLAILCCELTAQCSSLAPEWLGALYSLCCADEASYSCLQPSLLGLRPTDQSFYAPLGIFTSILIARQCFSLQAVVVNVITRSLVKAWGKGEGQPSPESEAGARLALNLQLRLFRAVDCFQPGSYTVAAASPRATVESTAPAANSTGIKFSCDRHLLSATHANISTGIPVGAIVAVLKAMLLLGDSVPRTLSESGSQQTPLALLHSLPMGEDLLTRSDQSALSLGELAHLALMQICAQDWVRDRCLQVTEDLCKQGLLLDNYLPAQQAQHLLRLICHTAHSSGKYHHHHHHDHQQPGLVIARIIRDLDEWSLRASMIDIKLMYLLEKKGGESVNSWLEDVSKAIVEAFKLGENCSSGYDNNKTENGGTSSDDEGEEDGDEDDGEEGEPAKKRRKIDSRQLAKPHQNAEEEGSRKRQRKFGPIWMIPHLVKGLKFLQTKILQVSGRLLETANWSRCAKSRVAAGHQPFLHLVLTCLRELELLAEAKAKSASSSSSTSASSSSLSTEDRDQVREQLLHSLPEVREQLLQSLHEQLSNFLCFTQEERVYNYEDPTARKTMQDALLLRFSLIGGMFDTITCNFQSITDWAILFVQLIVRGVIDLTNNADLYCTVVDMLTALIHSTLVIDREAGGSDRAEENRRLYLQLVRRIKKEIGDKQSQSIKYLRQLLPFPKQMDEVIVTEQFGLIPDSKGVKVRGFNCDKKQGLQVCEKQRISPWDLLEGHKNPVPLSFHWFQAVRTERKALKYEEAFQNMKYMRNNLQKPASHYLDPPPLPAEDLLHTGKDMHDGGGGGQACAVGGGGGGPGNMGGSSGDMMKSEHEKMMMMMGGGGVGGGRMMMMDEMSGDPMMMMHGGMGMNRGAMAAMMAAGGGNLRRGPAMMGGGPMMMGGPTRIMSPNAGGGGMGVGPGMMMMGPGGGGGMMGGGMGGGGGMMGGPSMYGQQPGYVGGGYYGGGGGGMGYNSGGGPGGSMGGGHPGMGQQPQMGYSNPMGYGGMGPAAGGGIPIAGGVPGPMQAGGGRYPGPGMPGTKQALQNMLRQRTTPGAGGGPYVNPGGGGGGGPPPGMVSMMRPSGQYGGGGGAMAPGGPPMTRPMYGQMAQGGMNPGYGMQPGGGQGGYPMGGYGGNSPQMRMNTPGPGGMGMRGNAVGGGVPPAQQYGMAGPMQPGGGGGGMRMPPAMSMGRSGMMGGPMGGAAPGYGMQAGTGGANAYGMQGGGGGQGGMMRPGMRMPGPPPPGGSMMGGLQGGGVGGGGTGGGGGMDGMQQQQGGQQAGGGSGGNMAAMQGGGGSGGGGMGGMVGMQQQQQGGSQLMAHLQRGNSNMGGQQQQGGMGGYQQQNRY